MNIEKAIMLSLHPRWCEKISNVIFHSTDEIPVYEKSIEIRKTRPKIQTPFKVYIYCTKPRHYYKISRHLLTSDESLFLVNGKIRMCDGFGVEYEDSEYKHLNCKVIGEFVCNSIRKISYRKNDTGVWLKSIVGEFILSESALSQEELSSYLKNGSGYAWNISNLVIYDKPRELSEFKTLCTDFYDGKHCDECEYFIDGRGYEYDESDCGCDGLKPLKRPPQSWCYVVPQI